jgi:hypothetical protein
MAGSACARAALRGARARIRLAAPVAAGCRHRSATASVDVTYFGGSVARKPNYRFERAERERLQAERQARRDQRKARTRDEPGSPPEQGARETTDIVTKTGDDLSEGRNG